MKMGSAMLKLVVMVLPVMCLARAGADPGSDPQLAFKPAKNGGFAFDTGVLRGELRAGGKTKGLSSVVHLPTGARLDSSMGLFSHYRVFSNGKRYGTGAWDWPSRAALRPDGSVLVTWTPSTDRPFDMTARYCWVEPNTLELETTVIAKADLKGFESFLASYFTPDFTNSLVCAGNPEAGSASPFRRAQASAGAWQAYPRDDSVIPLIRDGRWQLEPHPVDWVMMPRFAKPLCVRRSPATGVQTAMLSLPADCFAICTPHETEAHYSMYLSIFGRDLESGKSMRARTRLMVGTNWTDADLVTAHQNFVKSSTGH
jgi:hypothetical protein